ncbi:MAG TPA: IS30 family transposase [Candidatus Faecimonas gallistercoris]|nr:IS30 family transposase [Candidatus Faecimonas gallistercoris]
MSDTNNTLKKKENQYHHLTEQDRATIQTLIEQKDKNGKRLFNNSYIANYLGVHRSTISRELKNRKSYRFLIRSGRTIEKPYNAIDAHNNYLFKRGLSKGEYKLRKHSKMAKYIEDKIKIDKWAPDVIVGYMKTHNMFKNDGFCSISTPTVYNAIRYGIIHVKLEDTRRMKYKPEYEHKDKNSLPASKIPYSIENRPEEINNRSTFGHFEIDTVVGTKRGKHECLLTMTERKTKFEIIFKISAKTSEEVVNKINQIKIFMNRHYNKVFKSFSTDNGSEFSDFLNIIKDTKAKIYFCHPYCSGEKGTNEKQNSMIRYFIPKGTLIENYSFEDINNIATWMNNYPRKSLDYKTPLEAVLEEFNDKSIINKIYKLQETVNSI